MDGLLQQSAAAAGADLRPESKVIDLVYDDTGAVGGVVVQRRRQTRERLLADLVVGADGRNSTIAKLVGAEEYLGYDGARSVYWAYWQRPSDWSPHEYDNGFEGLSARVIFPTDRDQLLIATVPPLDVARSWRGHHTAAYLADIRGYEPVSSHLGDGEPVGEVRGVLKPRYFFRASAGRGWALIGDAGHHKEFVIGLGISDALRDAHSLAEALLTRRDGGEIERWWHQRDVERIEMFRWSQDLGRAQAVNALQRLVATRMPSSSHLHHRFTDIIDGRLSPYDLIPPGTAARWVAAAALRGDGKVFGPLVDTARRRAGARRELKRLKRYPQRSKQYHSEPSEADQENDRTTANL